MKNKLLLLVLSITFFGTAQQVKLKKGKITNSIPVNDSIPETFALYLPLNFDASKSWPIIFVFDVHGKGKQALSMFRQAADAQGYILAASNNVHDSIALSKNILISSRMIRTVYSLLPIKNGRSYSAGFSSGARLASILPTFVKEIKGVISCGASVANPEVISSKNRFHFIGIVGTEDYNYLPMIETQKFLNRLKFQNQLLLFEGGEQWPKSSYLEKAMEIFTLGAMTKGQETKDDNFVDATYQKNLGEVSALVSAEKPLLANKLLNEITSVYRTFIDLDSLKINSKTLRKTKLYKAQNRNQNAAFLREGFIKDEYSYLLEEDILAYNYNNLGWWKYQMDELAKYEKNINVFEKEMGRRLKSFVNALIADNVDIIKAQTSIDEEALLFLWMVNTITDVKKYDSYLKIISLSSKVEDYGTALFYLEELLKAGYSNTDELYALENTALLRIAPEFNELVTKYLKNARYETIEE